jgi:hypothetical protein
MTIVHPWPEVQVSFNKSEVLPPKRTRQSVLLGRRLEGGALLEPHDRIGSAERQRNVARAAASTVLHDLSRHRLMDQERPS